MSTSWVTYDHDLYARWPLFGYSEQLASYVDADAVEFVASN